MKAIKTTCPICKSEFSYEDSENIVCPSCGSLVFDISEETEKNVKLRYNKSSFVNSNTNDKIPSFFHVPYDSTRTEYEMHHPEFAREKAEANKNKQTTKEETKAKTNNSTTAKSKEKAKQTKSSHKPKSNRNIFGREKKESILDLREPYRFPSKFKVLRILYYILSAITAVYTVLACKPSLVGSGFGLNDYVILYQGATVFILLWLIWTIYYFVNSFKRKDFTKPKAISIIQYIISTILVVVVIGLVFTGVYPILYKIAPELVEGVLSADKIAKLPSELTLVKTEIFVILGCILLHLFVGALNKVRVNNQLREVYKVKFYNVAEFLIQFVRYVSCFTTIVIGIFTIVILAYPPILELLFETNALLFKGYIIKSLIISGSIYAGAHLINLIWLILEGVRYRRKRKKY